MGSYDDGKIRLDADGVLLRWYYFPFGQAKHIPWSEVRRARFTALTLLDGRWRWWGSGKLTVWLNLDTHRHKRRTLITLDLGKRIKPGLTPVDPEAAMGVLASYVKDVVPGS